MFLSRTAGTLSTGGRQTVMRGLVRFCGKGAMIVITRQLDAMGGTSRLVIVRENGVVRAKARARLVSHRNTCCRLIGGRLRLKDWQL